MYDDIRKNIMRLNRYQILTEGRGKQIDEEIAVSFIKAHCKKALKVFLDTDKVLYRGIGYEGDYYHVDPKTGTRESANTSNEYTMIMDNDPRWRSYPKRSKSLVCTTDTRKTNSYGHTYMVFAKDGSRYGVCRTDDLWQSFKLFKSMSMGTVNHTLRDLEDEFSDRNIIGAHTYEQLMDGIAELSDNLDDVVKTHTDPNYGVISNLMDNDLFRMWYKTKHVPFIDWFMSLYDPKDNDFYVTEDVNKIFTTGVKSKEIWTDGESVLVSFGYDFDEKFR